MTKNCSVQTCLPLRRNELDQLKQCDHVHLVNRDTMRQVQKCLHSHPGEIIIEMRLIAHSIATSQLITVKVGYGVQNKAAATYSHTFFGCGSTTRLQTELLGLCTKT